MRLPKVNMRRVHWHWTAGTWTPNATDLRAYHGVIDGDGKLHAGVDIARNSGKLYPGYAAHTRAANTDAVGLAVAGMAGAVEAPFNPGKFPIRPQQVVTLVKTTAEICNFYSIPVTPKTTLSHAEVQSNLGIRQNAKWDFTRLLELQGARLIGDWLRRQVQEELGMKPDVIVPAGALGVVTAGALNTRNRPNGDITGSLPGGTAVEITDQSGVWLQVVSPAGFTVWVHRDHVDLVDGPPPVAPTTPSPQRRMIAEMRALLDKYEEGLT